MIKGIVICGGIWAATATSVALVRRPHSEEPLAEGEVETLNPSEFISEGDEVLFASKYPSYFAATTVANKKFWEDRFNEIRDRNETIELNKHNGYSVLEIISAWDDPKEPHKTRHSLVGFCKKGYFSNAVPSSNGTLGLGYSEEDEWYPGESNFWSLCSVFDRKPDTVSYYYETVNKSANNPYSEGQIGNKLADRVIKADEDHAFWNIREQEWRVIEVTDSEYFGEDKKKKSSIKGLCQEAYSKKASETDNEEAPSEATVVKYCGLEWDWS